MIFNSVEFTIFLPIVFTIYWLVSQRSYHFQNSILLLASFFFCGWWGWKALLLVCLAATSSYFAGLGISYYQSSLNAKSIVKYRNPAWLICACNILLCLCILCLFKYYNFFIENFSTAFTFLGKRLEISTLKLALPLGISFYTLRVISYVIDVYCKKIQPATDYLAFITFVIYFPLMLAGPIQRATNSLNHFTQSRLFNYSRAADGLKQILYGLFKKAVIADNCALVVNDIFLRSPADVNGSTLFLGAFFFTFQIYCDFSGYSDMAIGISKLFGIEIMKNFDYPYFSRNIADFWRRWHISLTTWFRDYLYIPLGGNREGRLKTIRNVFIVFVVSGLWHGAQWTFIVWGLIHAFLFLPMIYFNRNSPERVHVVEGQFLPSRNDFLRMSITFLLVMLTWIFFRAETFNGAVEYIRCMFSWSLFRPPDGIKPFNILICTFFIILMIGIEWIQKNKEHGLIITNIKSPFVKKTIYIVLATLIFIFSAPSKYFIYMQF